MLRLPRRQPEAQSFTLEPLVPFEPRGPTLRVCAQSREEKADRDNSILAKKLNEFSNPPGRTRVRRSNFRQLISKCQVLTISVAASPAAHPKVHCHGHPLNGQVLKTPVTPAVPESRPLTTFSAKRLPSRDHPTATDARGAQNSHPRPGAYSDFVRICAEKTVSNMGVAAISR